MARFYYRYRGLFEQVDERFHDLPRVQYWHDEITIAAVVTSWKLSLYQDDFNRHPNNGTRKRIKVDEENYLGVESGKFAKVQDSNAIWHFLECPDDNSILVYYNDGSYYWNWKQVIGSEGLLQPNEVDNQTTKNYPNDHSFKFCSQSLDDCPQYSYIRLYNQQQYIKLNTSDDDSEEILQVEYRDDPPNCDCTNFLFIIDSVQDQK